MKICKYNNEVYYSEASKNKDMRVLKSLVPVPGFTPHVEYDSFVVHKKEVPLIDLDAYFTVTFQCLHNGTMFNLIVASDMKYCLYTIKKDADCVDIGVATKSHIAFKNVNPEDIQEYYIIKKDCFTGLEVKETLSHSEFLDAYAFYQF